MSFLFFGHRTGRGKRSLLIGDLYSTTPIYDLRITKPPWAPHHKKPEQAVPGEPGAAHDSHKGNQYSLIRLLTSKVYRFFDSIIQLCNLLRAFYSILQ